MKKYKVVDLFAGCGGLSDGFALSGLYDFKAHVEWDKSACQTLANRLKKKWSDREADIRVLRFDIQRTNDLLRGWQSDTAYGSSKGLLALTEGQPVDIVIGGPPCQAYSVAGRIRDQHGMHFDYRNYLFENYLEVVRHLQPRAVLFENVVGMLSAAPGGVSIKDRIRAGFDSAGYELIDDIREHAVFNCAEFGVPQDRRRVILVGLSRKQIDVNRQQALHLFYKHLMPGIQAPGGVIREAIGDLPAFHPLRKEKRAGGRLSSHAPFQSPVPNHYPRYHSRRDVAIFRELALDIASGENRYTSSEVLKKLYTQRTGRTANVHKYYVLRWDRLGTTIVAHLYKDGLRHIHPDPSQARSLTVREAARIQSFDDDFEFLGSMGDQFKMVGNAVPPQFARRLGIALAELMSICQNQTRLDEYQRSKCLCPQTECTGARLPLRSTASGRPILPDFEKGTPVLSAAQRYRP